MISTKKIFTGIKEKMNWLPRRSPASPSCSWRRSNARLFLQGLGACVRDNITFVEKQLSSGEPFQKGVSGYPKWVETMAFKYFDLEPQLLSTKRKSVISTLSGLVEFWVNSIEHLVDISNGVDENIPVA